MLSPLHAMLDERVMEITSVNYNLVNVPNLIQKTSLPEKTTIRIHRNSREREKQPDFEVQAYITHPTEGHHFVKVSHNEEKLHFSNTPNTGRR